MVFVAVQGTLLSNKWKKEYSSRLKYGAKVMWLLIWLCTKEMKKGRRMVS